MPASFSNSIIYLYFYKIPKNQVGQKRECRVLSRSFSALNPNHQIVHVIDATVNLAMEVRLITVVPVTKAKRTEGKGVGAVRALLQEHQSRLPLIIVNLSKNPSEVAP